MRQLKNIYSIVITFIKKTCNLWNDDTENIGLYSDSTSPSDSGLWLLQEKS